MGNIEYISRHPFEDQRSPSLDILFIFPNCYTDQLEYFVTVLRTHWTLRGSCRAFSVVNTRNMDIEERFTAAGEICHGLRHKSGKGQRSWMDYVDSVPKKLVSHGNGIPPVTNTKKVLGMRTVIRVQASQLEYGGKYIEGNAGCAGRTS